MIKGAGNIKLHVALAFDDRFCIPAFATMRSVCLTTRRRRDLVFHLCHPQLHARSLEVLSIITDEFGAELVHHDLCASAAFQHLAAILPHTKHISAVMYARMMLDQLVGDDISRLVYVDCDLLVRAPIDELLNSNLGGHPLGAVREPHAIRFAHGRDAIDNHDFFDPADPFFNSGVMVIDLDAWRQAGIADKLHDLEKEGTLARLSNDQQILNLLFKNNWKALDGGWNMFAASRAIEGLDPKIVHYTGLNKPWNLVSGLAFARVYRHVMTNELYYRFMRERWSAFWKRQALKLIGRA